MKRLNDTENRLRGPVGNYRKVQREKVAGMRRAVVTANNHITPRTGGHRFYQVQEVQSGIR